MTLFLNAFVSCVVLCLQSFIEMHDWKRVWILGILLCGVGVARAAADNGGGGHIVRFRDRVAFDAFRAGERLTIRGHATSPLEGF